MIGVNDLSVQIPFELLFLVIAIIFVFLIQWILQKIISRQLRKVERIPLDVINALKVLLQLGAAIIILYLIDFLYELPVEIILGVSALLGAIISFGSAQTLSNFIAGLYIVLTRPFGVDDFIALGNEIRGQVVEISLAYTKIRTINNIYHYIPNKNFMIANIIIYKQKIQRRIGITEAQDLQTQRSRMSNIKALALQLIEEEVVRYTFIWGAPLGNLKSTKEKIQEVCDIYAGVFGYKPEFFLFTLDYRMQFKFIVTTHSPEILLQNIREFRNEIVAKFH